MGQHSPRAVASVLSTVLLVAVVVVLAATVSVFAFDIGAGVDGEAPVVSQSSGTLSADVAGSNDQIVRLTHQAGDTLDVSNLEIAVDASTACGMSGRLVNLPAPGGDPQPTTEYVRGDDLFDNSANSVSGPIGEDGVTVDGRWSAGETATFRIANGACSLSPGDAITVRVVHTPSGAVLIEKTLTAQLP
jgi:flagellin-like protein